MKRQVGFGIIFLIFLSYAFFASIFFLYFGYPYLKGDSIIQFASDSITYQNAYESGYSVGFQIWGNYFGPLLILSIFKGNIVLPFVFNLFILLLSIFILKNKFLLNSNVFMFLIFLCPLVFFSIFGVNKEIFVLLYCAVLFKFLTKKSFFYFVPLLVIAFLIRWQFIVFTLILLFSYSNLVTSILSRKLQLILLSFLMSFLYVFLYQYIEAVDAVSLIAEKSGEGSSSGLYNLLMDIQRQGFYFIVAVPKFLQLFVGVSKDLFNPFVIADFWNKRVIASYCLFNIFILILTIRNFYKYKFNFSELDKDLIFVSLAFALFFCITPIFQPRYFLFISIILIIFNSRRRYLFYAK